VAWAHLLLLGADIHSQMDRPAQHELSQGTHRVVPWPPIVCTYGLGMTL
jgi:hypothetical protein